MAEQSPQPEGGLPLGTLLVAGGVLTAAAAYFTFFSQRSEPPPQEPGSALPRAEVNLAPPELRPGGQAPSGRPTQDSTLSVVEKGRDEEAGSLTFLRKNADVVQVDRSRMDSPFSQKDPAFDPSQAIPLGPALSFKGEDGPAQAGTRVIQDVKSWVATCRTLGVRDAPVVDFGAQMAVAVFSGEGPAGYGVEILGAEEKGGALQVTYRKTGPAPGQKFKGRARPYHIMAIPRSKSPVSFVEAK